jgi:hypothetical protein
MEECVMDSALPVLFFFGGLFALVMFALVCAVVSREQERTERSRSPTARELLGSTPFFGLAAASCAAPGEVDEALVRLLENYAREQQRLAIAFVARPSTEALARPESSRQPLNPSLVERVERHLKSECRAALAFVFNPSVERLLALPAAA